MAQLRVRVRAGLLWYFALAVVIAWAGVIWTASKGCIGPMFVAMLLGPSSAFPAEVARRTGPRAESARIATVRGA